MNHAELVMRRRNVRAFIKADPIVLNIVRLAEPQKTAAGGYRKSVAPAETVPSNQQARIVLNKRRYTAGIVNSEAGDIPHTDKLLIAEHFVNVQVNDTFVWLGENYKVTGIHQQRTESILASIDILGPVNRNAS